MKLPVLFILGYSLLQTVSCLSSLVLDRFRVVCPADLSAVAAYDADKLVKDNHPNAIWAAVYRSNNNKPSVFVKDEFLQAMNKATTQLQQQPSPSIEIRSSSSSAAPVAMARLVPSNVMEGTFVLDSMRCILKKENIDPNCDGGSEHNEAIAVAIDALLEVYLTTCQRFEGAIRTKATLFSAKLLEERGFQPVTTLHADMATHVSSLDACLERYAARSVASSIQMGAQRRALKVVSLLGRMNREMDLQLAKENQPDSREDDYDPWGSFQKHLLW